MKTEFNNGLIDIVLSKFIPDGCELPRVQMTMSFPSYTGFRQYGPYDLPEAIHINSALSDIAVRGICTNVINLPERKLPSMKEIQAEYDDLMDGVKPFAGEIADSIRELLKTE